MPSSRHEHPIELIRKCPEVVIPLLEQILGFPVPPTARVHSLSEEATQVVPATYRADNVVLLEPKDERSPRLAVIVEMQLAKDPRKLFTWPLYATEVRARLECPVVLVTICPDRSVADWARCAIDIGHPGFRLIPYVVGPGIEPFVTSTAQAAANPELAVIAAVSNTLPDRERAGMEIVHGALATMLNQGDDRAKLYSDAVLSALPEAAKKILEELMRTGTDEYKSDFARGYFAEGKTEGKAEGKVEGRAEGKAEAVLKMLEVRRVAVSEAEHERIMACNDAEQLDAWIERVMSVETAAELFT
ncbi:hypothetical protein [Actinomadura parmotrematis]|uniref:Rpn family recombination-promoting nuclease/putative transposase n=1 Tax=Actinomadura parmotrematis TaxID=2864039 RepID=A0ABS7FVC6_9ACTN|nr:hypothetical protein [Actinomadura parmotrematis]MBW8484367.1 hypothetical protein [Actinomadura parmotrematis]